MEPSRHEANVQTSLVSSMRASPVPDIIPERPLQHGISEKDLKSSMVGGKESGVEQRQSAISPIAEVEASEEVQSPSMIRKMKEA